MRVKGRWKYLYRAIDKEGATLDFYLADRRNAKAAKRFLAKALRRSRDWMPRVINTDKNPAYGEAIAELKKEGLLPKETQHRPAPRPNRAAVHRPTPRRTFRANPLALIARKVSNYKSTAPQPEQ